MSELELAIRFLKKRAISTKGNPNLEADKSVIPEEDVISVLEMVKNHEFIEFYKKIKNIVPEGEL